MLGRMDSAILATLIGNLKSFSQTFTGAANGVPRGVAEPLIFQYTDGVRFVAEAYQRGGWQAVDKLYADPPQSTQQIIDPSLYFDHPYPARYGDRRGLPVAYGRMAQVRRRYAGRARPAHRVRKRARRGFARFGDRRRWAGDRIVMLRKGDAVSVIWLLTFREADSAARFAAVYRDLLDHLHGPSGGPSRRTQRQGGARCDRRSGRTLQSVGPAVWKASVITPPPPPISPGSPSLHAEARPASDALARRIAAAD